MGTRLTPKMIRGKDILEEVGKFGPTPKRLIMHCKGHGWHQVTHLPVDGYNYYFAVNGQGIGESVTPQAGDAVFSKGPLPEGLEYENAYRGQAEFIKYVTKEAK